MSDKSDAPRMVTERITGYLAGGGLFNPELANHAAVRDLLIDARDELAQARAELSRVTLLNDGHQRLATTYRERAEKAEADNAALREDARPFPMQDGPPIPWSLAKIIYAGYSALFGTNQSLERLAERGGFGWSEVSGIYNHPRTRAAIDAARKGET